ncbi:hypothetical protein ACWCP8_13760 [Streptomyces sp. NPDC002206]
MATANERYGRGLLIVAQLADHRGVEPRTIGKIVFAELALAPPSGQTTVGLRVETRRPTGGAGSKAIRPR